MLSCWCLASAWHHGSGGARLKPGIVPRRCRPSRILLWRLRAGPSPRQNGERGKVPSPPPLRGRGQRPALLPAEGEGRPLAQLLVPGFSLAPWLGRCQAEARHRPPAVPPLTHFALAPARRALSPHAPKALRGEGMSETYPRFAAPCDTAPCLTPLPGSVDVCWRLRGVEHGGTSQEAPTCPAGPTRLGRAMMRLGLSSAVSGCVQGLRTLICSASDGRDVSQTTCHRSGTRLSKFGQPDEGPGVGARNPGEATSPSPN